MRTSHLKICMECGSVQNKCFNYKIKQINLIWIRNQSLIWIRSIKMILIKAITLCIFLTPCESMISIDIDPMELQSIGEVLVESYLHHNLIQKKIPMPQTILMKVLKYSSGVVQMLGVTASLIAANIFTPFFQFSKEPTVDNALTLVRVNPKNDTLSAPSQNCPNDFGCERNICWISCDVKVKNSTVKSWCYSSPAPQYRKHAICRHITDCSPCWKCLGVCNIPQT